MTWKTKQTGVHRGTVPIRDEDGKHVRFAVQTSTVEMSIEVDWNALAKYFAGKLHKSKGGTSKIQNGAIIARRIKVTKVRS